MGSPDPAPEHKTTQQQQQQYHQQCPASPLFPVYWPPTSPPASPLWPWAWVRSIQTTPVSVLTPTRGWPTPWAPAGPWRGAGRPAATSARELSSCPTHTAAPLTPRRAAT